MSLGRYYIWMILTVALSVGGALFAKNKSVIEPLGAKTAVSKMSLPAASVIQ